jgi:hypothetical protein
VKTISLKKVSAVAVAALAFGGLTSVAPAQAAEGDIACTAYNNSSCTQVVGGTVAMTFEVAVPTTTANTYTVTGTGVGSVSNSSLAAATSESTAGDASNITGTTGTTVTFPSQNFDVLSALKSSGATTQVLTLTLYSGVVGSQTITIVKKNASGTPTNTYTKTVTWVAASATGINASKTHMYVKAAGTTCATPGASYEADVVASTNTSRFAAGASVDICVVARDINNNLVSIIGTASTVTSSAGVSDATATDDGGGAALFDLDSPSLLITGNVTFNAVLIDTAGNVATKSLTVPFYGSLTTLTLATVKSAAYAGTDATSPADTFAGIAAEAATSDTIVVGITGKDSAGATIDLNAAANSITTSTWTIDSDKTAGAPAIRTGDTVGAVLSSVAPESTELSSSSSYGTNVAYIDCSSKAEKLTITAYGKNSNGDWVASNTIDVYCSAATSTVTVAPSATSVAAGGTLAINVSVKDANGYPVADGTSVTLAANNGAVMAPSSKTTAGGAFTTAANLVAGSESATTTVTAIAGGKTGTALINITGGSTRQSAQTMLDNLNAKIVALNALIAKIMKKLGVK